MRIIKVKRCEDCPFVSGVPLRCRKMPCAFGDYKPHSDNDVPIPEWCPLEKEEQLKKGTTAN